MRWELPPELAAALPAFVARLANEGEPRDRLAAARVLMEMARENREDKQQQPGPVVIEFVPYAVRNPEAEETGPSAAPRGAVGGDGEGSTVQRVGVREEVRENNAGAAPGDNAGGG
jgi:hypothetical protein